MSKRFNSFKSIGRMSAAFATSIELEQLLEIKKLVSKFDSADEIITLRNLIADDEDAVITTATKKGK